MAWGLAIAAFGLVTVSFPLALLFLALAGAADVFSAVFRSTLVQFETPDQLRGRVMSIHTLVVTSGPRIGDIEAAIVASLIGPQFAVVSGGILCVVGAGVVARRFPELREYGAAADPGRRRDRLTAVAAQDGSRPRGSCRTGSGMGLVDENASRAPMVPRYSSPGAIPSCLAPAGPVSLVGAFLIVAALLPASATPVAAAGATVPAGFADEEVWTGLDHPMAVAFAPDGKVFVAEKRGHDQRLRQPDRPDARRLRGPQRQRPQLLGPRHDGAGRRPGLHASGDPYVYVLYAYNHILGDRPRRRAGRPAAPNPWTEIMPDTRPGRPTVASSPARLSRLTSTGGDDDRRRERPHRGLVPAVPEPLVGDLAFGPDGALYVSRRRRRELQRSPDYGQLGGTLPDARRSTRAAIRRWRRGP